MTLETEDLEKMKIGLISSYKGIGIYSYEKVRNIEKNLSYHMVMEHRGNSEMQHVIEIVKKMIDEKLTQKDQPKIVFALFGSQNAGLYINWTEFTKSS